MQLVGIALDKVPAARAMAGVRDRIPGAGDLLHGLRGADRISFSYLGIGRASFPMRLMWSGYD